MKKKRYSDISFLPAFLVPSTVIKFLFYWRPVDRLERSTLTVSYKRNYHKKKVPTPSSLVLNHTLFLKLFFLIPLNVALWLVSSLKRNQIQYILFFFSFF